MSSVEDLGNQAYKKALFQDFKGAIAILDKAISKFPRDPRLYNNRSYCHFRLKNYTRALTDAEFMVKHFPGYSKSYYRKAEALVELKKYREAELAVREFLDFEPKCEEAKFLLSEAQVRGLCSTGKHWVKDAARALRLTDNDTAKAAQFLKTSTGSRKEPSWRSCDVYHSDEEKTSEPGCDPYTDPSNPFNCCSIWVGHITKQVTTDKLKSIFGKYGKIKGDIVVHQNSCAFVNYAEPKMAALAMKKFPQNFPVEDTTLVIRYPLNNHVNLNHINLISRAKKSPVQVR